MPYAQTTFNSDAPDWNSITATAVIDVPELLDDGRVRLRTSDGDLYLEINALGVRLSSAVQRNDDYGLLIREPHPKPLTLDMQKDGASLISGELSITIEYQPFTIEVSLAGGKVRLKSPTDGHFVRHHRIPPLAKVAQGWLFACDLKSTEAVYGLGEKWGALNKRGQLIRSFNHDALGVNAEISYKNIPFCWSPEGWGLLFHTSASVTHSVGYAQWSHRSYCALLEDDVLDVFLFITNEENVARALIQSYTELTGRAPMPPLWSGGVILSKAYYKTPDELLSVARQVRERGMPCDVITIDGRAWQDTDTRFAFEWDSSRWPNPASVLNELKRLGFKVCVWEYPLISVKHAWFKEFEKKGWLLKDKRSGAAYRYHWDRQAFGPVLTDLPESGIVDFTHPDAYAFWHDQHKDLFDLGVDMIKADFGEQLDDDNMLAHTGQSGLVLHNVYAHLYSRCVYEAAESFSTHGPFLFARAAWTGCQRFNSHWGGDPQSDWEGMMANIRGGLSWGLSGGPFYATDVGGFYKDTRDDALYVRWAQAGVFSAHYRLHGLGRREPWSYSESAAAAVNQALQLRYRLQIYLRQAMRQATTESIPVQRAMVLAFPNEKQAWAFDNQFMFGDDLLVVPCFDPDGDVEFYLPKGHWFTFTPDTAANEVLTGQRVYKRQLALNEMAVFARSGTQIPLCRAVQSTQEFSDEIEVDEVWKACTTN